MNKAQREPEIKKTHAKIKQKALALDRHPK